MLKEPVMEISRPDFMGLGLVSGSLKGLGLDLVSVSRFKGLGLDRDYLLYRDHKT